MPIVWQSIHTSNTTHLYDTVANMNWATKNLNQAHNFPVQETCKCVISCNPWIFLEILGFALDLPVVFRLIVNRLMKKAMHRVHEFRLIAWRTKLDFQISPPIY